MAQKKIKLNSTEIRQPDEGLAYSFETTFASSTKRVASGRLSANPMFTVEALTYTATGATVAEVKQILQIIAKGNSFSLYYFSPYYGAWRTDTFYVGRGDLTIGTLDEDGERYDSITFQMTGVNPI